MFCGKFFFHLFSIYDTNFVIGFLCDGKLCVYGTLYLELALQFDCECTLFFPTPEVRSC